MKYLVGKTNQRNTTNLTRNCWYRRPKIDIHRRIYTSLFEIIVVVKDIRTSLEQLITPRFFRFNQSNIKKSKQEKAVIDCNKQFHFQLQLQGKYSLSLLCLEVRQCAFRIFKYFRTSIQSNFKKAISKNWITEQIQEAAVWV